MPLAKPGDPYVNDKGHVLLPKSGDQMDAIPRAETVLGAPVAKNIVSTERRTVKDLPASNVKLQTAINVCIVYQLLGLTDNEVAFITGIPLEDMPRIKNDPAYQETFDVIFGQMISVNSNSLQSKIAHYAGEALDNVINIAKTSKHEMARLKANQDVLDRAGLHPEVLFGKNKQEDGFDSLKIVIQSDDDKETKVDIDLSRSK